MPSPASAPQPLRALPVQSKIEHLAIGVFDGVHLGHQSVIQNLLEQSARPADNTGVITFEPHPLEVIAPERAPVRLMTPHQRERLLKQMGAGKVYTTAFDAETRQLSAQAFVLELLRIFPELRSISIGLRWVFGYDRQGNAQFLEKIGAERGFTVHEMPSFVHDGAVVSSTRIRKLLHDRELEAAARLLGRPYALEGLVEHGDQRGRSIGFRTANLGQIKQLVPPGGVYACLAKFDVHVLPAVVNIGTRPTFDGQDTSVEAHLLDYDGDLYGHLVELSAFQFLREEKKFDGPRALQAQIQADVAAARQLLEKEL